MIHPLHLSFSPLSFSLQPTSINNSHNQFLSSLQSNHQQNYTSSCHKVYPKYISSQKAQQNCTSSTARYPTSKFNRIEAYQNSTLPTCKIKFTSFQFHVHLIIAHHQVIHLPVILGEREIAKHREREKEVRLCADDWIGDVQNVGRALKKKSVCKLR